ncbi:MAG: hypothetical protein OXI41_07745 [Chloroflexota bacterium]|nr:hypothetical protein [Chloroflexota bacterium]MDE2895156.1 hypothetical protein [Chloroflexota bacterium]
MGSRIGSIAILLVIGGIVAAVVVVINRLDLLNTGESDAPVMVVSLDEGELVLLNEPRSITVTISSGSPIATLELFVDDAKIADVVPPYSQDRGAWIGSFVWTPERLGFASVRVVALDADGEESFRQIRVEVTDDQARVAAALRVTVLGIAPLQQFPAGTTILLAISATGSQPIERFEMLVNDNFVIAITPRLDEATGRYSATIEWTPGETGEVDVTINAVDAAGRTESQTIPVVLVPQGRAAETTAVEESQERGGTDERTADDGPAAEGVGAARIASPSDGERFTLDSDFELDVELQAQNIGVVASALLYITPIAPDNTLGNSVLIHSSEDHPAGDYRERVVDVEDFIASSGSYELQLVIFTPEDDRYDHRIVIHVVAVADQDGADAEDDEQDEQSEASDEIDLAIVTARQADDDRTRLNVTITNDSTVDIDRTEVVVTVVEASSGAELASAAVTLGIESDDLRTIPLDLKLDPGEQVEALVVLEASIDTNTANNTFQITLTAPESDSQDETSQSPEDSQQSGQQSPSTQPESETPRPDLTFLDAQYTNDGYVLVTVINNGAGPAETFFIVVANEAGEQIEVITRRSADAQPLDSGQTEILTSLEPHSGTIVMTIVAGGDIAEDNLEDNRLTLEIGS